MNEDEKQQYVESRVDLIKNCVVTDLDIEYHGEVVYLVTIHLRHPNGNEFVILPLDWQQLHIVQTLWGSN